MISNKTNIVRNNTITAVPLGDELSMLDIETGKYYLLNSIASHIWSKLEEPNSVDSLIKGLLNEYEIDQKTCRDSVYKYLNDMVTKNLVNVVSA